MAINNTDFPMLAKIDSPAQLRQLPEQQLPKLAQELREYLLQSLNQCGGHLGASLGTVELTIALHYIFNTPKDNVVWDVGHQAYGHKILTGRRDNITSIRHKGGLAPFTSPAESEYDAFTVGHSSTSISAALGMSIAAKLNQQNNKSIAVIGDGAMTAGMAFEALNHAGDLHSDLIVILNDNEMSISENVGALTKNFAKMFSGKVYNSLREGGKKVLEKIPPMWELVKRSEEHVKGMIMPGTLFEEFGFNYFGPIDGHDLPSLLKTLSTVKGLSGPKLIHVMTTKGKGFAPAEAQPITYHAVSPGFYQSGNKSQPEKKKQTYSNIFGRWVCDMAERDHKIVAITPAMREGSDLVEFSKRFPDRYFDVAIAEQHSVTVAAGMATQGLKPVVAIYSTFLQRAYDQLIHDVALQNLPVVFAIDRAGLVGGDGATHNGAYDLSYLRCIPNMTIMAAADENELRHMLHTGVALQSPCAVRYPRGTVTGLPLDTEMKTLTVGKAEIKRQGHNLAILSFGAMLQNSLVVGEKLDATVVNMRFVKPLDEALIIQLAKQHKFIITVEENVIAGGAGSGVNECLLRNNLHVKVLNLGLPDKFVEHGAPNELLADCGLTAEGIEDAILKQHPTLKLDTLSTTT